MKLSSRKQLLKEAESVLSNIREANTNVNSMIADIDSHAKQINNLLSGIMTPFDKLVDISRQLDKMEQSIKKWPDYNRSKIRSVKLGLVGMSHRDEGVWGLMNKSTELSGKTRWKIAFNGTNPSGVKPVLYLYTNIEKLPIANLTGRKIAEYLNGVN
jgi:septal ring factor EnvC (AmiA/AmiB activator)